MQIPANASTTHPDEAGPVALRAGCVKNRHGNFTHGTADGSLGSTLNAALSGSALRYDEVTIATT